MPYGEESAYAAQAALKKKSPAYKKSSGFKMKGIKHILPGIDQTLDNDPKNVAEQGLPGSSAFQTKGSALKHPHTIKEGAPKDEKVAHGKYGHNTKTGISVAQGGVKEEPLGKI